MAANVYYILRELLSRRDHNRLGRLEKDLTKKNHHHHSEGWYAHVCSSHVQTVLQSISF